MENKFTYNNESLFDDVFYTVKIIDNAYKLLPFANDENFNVIRLSHTPFHLKKKKMKPKMENKIKMWENIIKNSNLITNNEDIFINEDVIPFITYCSKVGTVHGYHDLFSIIIKYLDDLNKYSKYKILIYKDSQQGLLDIIDHLCYLNVLDKNKLIFIDSNKIYKFKSMCFIKNIYDSYNIDTNKEEILTFLKKLITFKNNYIINKVSYLKPPKFNIDNILIVKTQQINNVLKHDKLSFNDNEVIEFCKKYNYTCIKPETMNEVVFYNLLNNGKKYIFSFGSSFLKNYPFININCQKIDVISKIGTKYQKEMEGYVKKNYFLSKETFNLKTDINFHSIENFKDFELK